MSIKHHSCHIEGCEKKFKRASHLKQHKADVHDIDVKWNPCDVDGCEKKFK